MAAESNTTSTNQNRTSGVTWLPRWPAREAAPDAGAVGEAATRIAHSRSLRPELWNSQEHTIERTVGMLDALRLSHGDVVDVAEFDRAESVLRKAHEIHDGAVEIEPFDYAFVVPTRTSTAGYVHNAALSTQELGLAILGHPGMEYAEELDQTVPFVDRLDPLTRTQLCTSIPPTIIDRFDPSPTGRHGAIVYAPLTIDMIFSAPDRRALRDLAVARIGSGLDFAQRVGRANFAGLGAFFPSLTRYGQLLARDGMQLTTGHAGTIAMMAKTLGRILGAPGYESCSTIGIVGAGAIGTSTTDHLAATTDHDFVIFDTDASVADRLASKVDQTYGSGRARTAGDMQQVCDQVRIVMAATTTPVPFDELRHTEALRGLVIVDDSEPGAFNDRRYRESGARPVGVVGEVPLALGQRANAYNYGGELAAAHHVYGCEAEVKTMDELGLHAHGITRRAEPADVAFVADCFEQVGVRASPLQHRGALEFLVDDDELDALQAEL